MMKRWSTCGALALAIGACAPTVVDERAGASASGNEGNTATSTVGTGYGVGGVGGGFSNTATATVGSVASGYGTGGSYGDTGTSTVTTGTNGGASGGGHGLVTSALATRARDLPGGTIPWEVEGASAPPGVGDARSPNEGPLPPGVDPDALVFFFSSEPEACARPAVTLPCDATGSWQMVVIVPPSLAQGRVVDLRDPGVLVYQGVVLDRMGSGGCGFGAGGGPGMVGALTIVASDAATLTVTISGGLVTLGGDVLDGAYTAIRCDAPVPGSGPRGIPRGARAMEARP